MTDLLPLQPVQQSRIIPVKILEAIAFLKDGHLVALPTETVYGLAAAAHHPEAIQAVFQLKGRPSTHPLILHVGASPESWARYVRNVPSIAEALMQAFWPGPLTLILPRHPSITPLITGGRDTLALRMPAHPVAQAVLDGGQLAVVAPSANRFGAISPTTLAHVRHEFEEHPLLLQQGNTGHGLRTPKNDLLRLGLLDGGPCEIGVESTIVDVSDTARSGVRVLRRGHIQPDALRTLTEAYHLPLYDAGNTRHDTSSHTTEASGTYARHYAPQTPAHLVHVGELEEQVWQAVQAGKRVGVWAVSQCPQFPECQQGQVYWQEAPSEPETYAHHLYATLRELDAAHCDVLFIEATPPGDAWAAVHDRLQRATCNI
jgi:L-threonylcarbamoyladenylate synthase